MSGWRVLGVDASPAGTGIARPDGGHETWINKLKAKEPTGARLTFLYDHATALLDEHRVDLVVIEAYNYGLKKFGDVFGIGEAAGVIKLAIAQRGIPLVSVSPGGRAKFATGTGRGNKDLVLSEWSRITGVDFAGDHNQADASVLRELGMHLLGEPTYQLSSDRLLALTAVKKNPWNAAALKLTKERAA
jgi:Holliday junction resolvasome RuvABC endonuclease subunit